MRPARAGEAASLARVQVASWRRDLAGIVPAALLAELTSDEAEDMWRDRWREAITNPPTSRHHVLAAVTESPPREVVGFISAGPATDADRWPGTDGEVYELRVLPERTGCGHGSRLLHAAADTLAGDGFHTLYTWALEADMDCAGSWSPRAGPPTAPGANSTWARASRWYACTRPSANDSGALGSVRGSAREWLAGTRPRTLPAAVVPVLIGSGVAFGTTGSPGGGRCSRWWLRSRCRSGSTSPTTTATACAARTRGGSARSGWSPRGSHRRDRCWPRRSAASSWPAPAGLALAAVTSWWLVAVGAACIAAAWFYTGGPRPYGYNGLGEVFVFAFFGVVAVAGTATCRCRPFSWLGLAASVPAGLLACALLMVNNLRDIRTDTLAGKRTLAVTLGDARSRAAYVLTLLLPFCIAALIAFFRPFTLVTAVALPLARLPVRSVRRARRARP